MAPIYFTILVLFLAVSPEASAEFYACPTIDGDVYRESSAQPDCRLLGIQPPALIYERANTARGFLIKPEGPWPRGSAEAEAEICGLYRQWTGLAKNRYHGLVIYPPQGLTPREMNRLNNLDQVFSHRGEPSCSNKP